MFWAAFRIASEDLVLGGVSGGCVKREDRSVKMAEGGNKEGSDSRHGPKAARDGGRPGSGWMNHIPRCEKTPGLLSCHGFVGAFLKIRGQKFLPHDFIEKETNLFRITSFPIS